MPNTTSEEDKKHGDKLQSLIDRTGSSASPGKRSEAVDDDAPAARQDDDDEDEIDEDEDDDEIDEDIQPDDVEDPSAGGR
jgi:hypothetical protein